MRDWIDNFESLYLHKTDYYAAIIGETPSQGAKSPDLWNAAFDGLDLSAVMHPFDVQSGNLASLVIALREDQRFLGGKEQNCLGYRHSIHAYHFYEQGPEEL